MYEFVLMMLVIIVPVILLPTIGLGLLALFEGFPRITLGQVARIVAVAAWVLGLFARKGPWEDEAYPVASAAVLILLFFGLWRRELRLLMLRRDEEFPGRFDKVGWMVILTFVAPAGVWLYRSFRMARWPDPAVKSVARPEMLDPHPTDEREVTWKSR